MAIGVERPMPLAMEQPHLAIWSQDPLLKAERCRGLEGMLNRALRILSILGMDPGEIALKGWFECVGRQPEYSAELLRSSHAVRVDLPLVAPELRDSLGFNELFTAPPDLFLASTQRRILCSLGDGNGGDVGAGVDQAKMFRSRTVWFGEVER